MQVKFNKTDIVIIAVIRENDDDEFSEIKELKSYNNKIYTLKDIKEQMSQGINVHILGTKINNKGIVEMSLTNGLNYFL